MRAVVFHIVVVRLVNGIVCEMRDPKVLTEQAELVGMGLLPIELCPPEVFNAVFMGDTGRCRDSRYIEGSVAVSCCGGVINYIVGVLYELFGTRLERELVRGCWR